MIRKMGYLGGTLAGICAVAAFGLGYTYSVTRGRIEEQIREGQLRAARAVLPDVADPAGIREDGAALQRLKVPHPAVAKVFAGYDGDRLAGYAIQVVSRGYGGPVSLVVGVTPDGRVTAISVVEHKETPGLGSYIEDPAWRKQFAGKTAADPLVPNRDVEAVSGATISAKAVTRGVREALAAAGLLGGTGQ